MLNVLFCLTKMGNWSQFTPFPVATFETIYRYSSFYIRLKTIPNGSPIVHEWSLKEFTVWFLWCRSRGSSISAFNFWSICYMILKVVRTYAGKTFCIRLVKGMWSNLIMWIVLYMVYYILYTGLFLLLFSEVL